MKTYARRKMTGLRAPCDPAWAQLGDPDGLPLSAILEQMRSDRLFLCGSLEQMSREYVEEPLKNGWEFARDYVHKFRSPVYRCGADDDCCSMDDRGRPKTISVKLISESWFPGCESAMEAIPAWRALKDEWQSTGLPLLTTPAATGRALLWETLPKLTPFPSLPDDVAKLIRRVSPQHRREVLEPDTMHYDVYCYDGRWMYAALCSIDRFPVGEPKAVRPGAFVPYVPGWYHVRIDAPRDWNHIGLIPYADDDGAWVYPNGHFETWASEPELTLALENGWRIEVIEGWSFAKGRPLDGWAKKLIAMRERLRDSDEWIGDLNKQAPGRIFAAAAVRNILNHTIGSLHVDGYEREVFVSHADFKQWFQDNRDYIARGGEWGEKTEGGYLCRAIVPSDSPMAIYMPHWSATVWALERARVAQWALRCDPRVLVKINGDAIYSTAELPFTDNRKLGQLRRKQ